MDDRKVLRYDQDAVVALLDALYCLVWTKVLRDKVADCSLTIRATINPRLNYSNFFSIISFLDTFLLMIFRLYINLCLHAMTKVQAYGCFLLFCAYAWKGDNSYDHLRTTFQFEETLSIFGGTFALLEMIHEWIWPRFSLWWPTRRYGTGKQRLRPFCLGSYKLISL